MGANSPPPRRGVRCTCSATSFPSTSRRSTSSSSAAGPIGCGAPREMIQGLQAWGVDVSFDDVVTEANGAAIGRPHLARVLMRLGKVTSIEDAFREWLGRGRPAYVEKTLPAFHEIAELVHSVGGIVSAAHLKDRGTRAALTAFRDEGLDAVETRHPATAARPGPSHRAGRGAWPASHRRERLARGRGGGWNPRDAGFPVGAGGVAGADGPERARAQSQRMIEQAAPLRDVAIIGGGCYGSFYAAQLETACRKGKLAVRRVLVVDRDPACRAAMTSIRTPAGRLWWRSGTIFSVTF